ncbi:hypothetical protein O181_101548 [Austropuccinia psidii MF-1]|uniref:Reverse transcriptase Ty1/copia-type domain-containing protein n=1 Tax=Austropuccinia psidii MF-1 TaxID=1389203 RepID=A0A9Q3JEN5_9BASI|nr:hypothetical protein [Austropuccinia psidii MF-1]
MEEENFFKVCTLADALKHVDSKDILSTKWVFAKKTKPIQYKAQLGARGYRQTYGVNFEEMFAPTPTFNALRLLFAVSVKMKWPLRTFDVKVAFLHSLIDIPIYLWPPKGMQLTKGQVVCLNKALSGTKQAARCWWQHSIGILRRIGFKPNDEDLSTYVYKTQKGTTILWIHVNDGALTASSKTLLTHIIVLLEASLWIKWDEEVNSLIGIKIKQTQDGYSFSQSDLIYKLISITPSTITIAILLYIAQGSRPDIAFSVNYLVRFSMATNQTHWDALEHLIAYMRYTSTLGICIAPRGDVRGLEYFVDANWGGEGNRSTHGFFLLFHGLPIGWQSKRQATVASSTWHWHLRQGKHSGLLSSSVRPLAISYHTGYPIIKPQSAFLQTLPATNRCNI